MSELPRCLLFTIACGCGPSLDLGLPAARGTPAVTVEPAGTLEQAPSVLRLRIAGAYSRSNLADFRVFRGALSAYHLGRLRQREPPSTLLEREIPSAVWGEGADVVVAPTAALGGGTVALASPELGLLAEVSVDETLTPLLERHWPPPEQRVGRGPMIFCGDGASELVEATVVLEPASVPAIVRSGLGGDATVERECVRLEPGDAVPDGALLLPPPLLGGFAFEPLPLVIGPLPQLDGGCQPEELPFGPGCALVQDDRVRLRAAAEASFWVLREPEPHLFVLSPGRSQVVRGLEPMRPVRLFATVFGLEGTSESIELEVLAASTIPHVVINEVLANPVGPERTSEWIELVNDGAEAVALGGFELRDATGVARLPDAVLAPGEHALVVADGFTPDPELDVVHPDGVQRLMVPALGGGGLANGGELLRLVDREGRVVSRFPSVSATEAGRSVARITPEAPDGDAGAFAAHAEPGASPGRPNVLRPEP